MRTPVKPFGGCVLGSSSLGFHFGLMLKEQCHNQATEEGKCALGAVGGAGRGPGRWTESRTRSPQSGARASHLRQSLGPGERLSSPPPPSSRVWERKGCKSSYCRWGRRWRYIGITPPETDFRRPTRAPWRDNVSVSDSPGKRVRTQAPTPPCVHQRRPSRRLCRGRRPASPSPPLPRC